MPFLKGIPIHCLSQKALMKNAFWTEGILARRLCEKRYSIDKRQTGTSKVCTRRTLCENGVRGGHVERTGPAAGSDQQPWRLSNISVARGEEMKVRAHNYEIKCKSKRARAYQMSTATLSCGQSRS